MLSYEKSFQDVLKEMEAGERGLASDEAEKRLQRYGPNALTTQAAVRPLHILLHQFQDSIIFILLAAVFLSLFIGEYTDSIIILAILLLNGAIGFFQELSAQKSLESLQQMAATKVRVLRDEKTLFIDATGLVPGDILLLEAGDKVGADARIIESVRLTIAEDILTGESTPVEKKNTALHGTAQLGDRKNMVYSATSVVSGRGRAVVTATGMMTELGRITRIVSATESVMTPLQRRMHEFGKKLGFTILAICVVVFLLFAGRDFFSNGFSLLSLTDFFFLGVSLAVAAVPTALPAVVTIALSIGVKRLLAKKALVRNLSSVEALGSCDVICTDKTGTLTKNQMMVRYAWSLDGESRLSGNGYDPTGEVSGNADALLFRSGLFCNNSGIEKGEDGWQLRGEPTEAALVVSARKAGVKTQGERLDELPFDSERKIMSVHVRHLDTTEMMYSKGAPGELLDCCRHVVCSGQVLTLTDVLRDEILKQNDFYAGKALRVLGFAIKKMPASSGFKEEDLIFVGLQAMKDPPREDVADSIAKTQKAGIRVIMITGDYVATAAAIGHEIGIEGQVCTGIELEKMHDTQLLESLHNGTNIFARVIPEHKQRIIAQLQKDGHIVAMTGDGVNDAPALKKADIGVAVGSGSEVAKETADFVLLDDSFTHLVNAIEEGRGIYDNIQKSIMLLLSGNLGEVLIIFFAALFGLHLPLTAVLLLWINMVTDGAPALAFAVDPYSKNIMDRPPKPKKEQILPVDKLRLIAVLGLGGTMIALGLFAVFSGKDPQESELRLGQTMVFNFVILYECILVFVIRRGYGVGMLENVWVWAAVGLSLALQAILMYTPLYSFFKIVPLGPMHLVVLFLAAVLFYLFTKGYAMLENVVWGERFDAASNFFRYRE